MVKYEGKTMNEEIKNIIADELGIDGGILTDDCQISDVPEWDSMGYLAVLMTLGKQYGIKYTREELVDVETVGDLISLTIEKAG